MKSILAIDLGTKFGYAVYANGITSSGHKDLTRYKGCKSRSADHIGQPISDFRDWLHGAITDGRPDVIVIESVYRWSSSAASIAYGRYNGIVVDEACRFEIPVVGYSPTHIKKHWTGKGNCKKDLMIAEAQKRYPEENLTDDNECDALAILDLHLTSTKETHEIRP